MNGPIPASPLPPESEPLPPPTADYDAALRFLYDRINYEKTGGPGTRYPFRLKRMRELLERMGLAKFLHQPGNRTAVPIIHIAGTKGKGSTSTFVAAMLSAAGYKTGLYTSPHLERLEERFQVDGRPCSPDQLVERVAMLRDCLSRIPSAEAPANSQSDPFSFFELTTALAFAHFDHQHCDCIVLEVGLGGRLDSTNVCGPTVTAITSIGLDHQHVLGNTLAEIAAEKAGIIKPGIPLISGVLDAEPREVIERVARTHDAPLFQINRDFTIQSEPAAEWGSRLTFRGHTAPLRNSFQAIVGLEGQHQTRNAGVALAILDLLRHQGLAVDASGEAEVLANLRCIGRIERYHLGAQVTGIVDAAHNPDSIAALCDVLRLRAMNRPITFVFATSRDKDANVMLGQLAPLAKHMVLTQYRGNPRFLPTEEMMQGVPNSIRSSTSVVNDPLDACNEGLRLASPGGMLVICGSFFLAAETRQWLIARAT